MKGDDFAKGQTVYLLVITGSNEYRRLKRIEQDIVPIENRIIETTVKSVNKKFVTVEYNNIKFDVNNDFKEHSNYSKNYELFLDEQSIYDAVESDKLFRDISSYFRQTYKNPLTLEQLRKISEILNISNE